MRNIIFFLTFLCLSISAFSAIPYRVIEKTLSVGDGSTSDIKIEADIGSGVLNPYLKLDSTSGKWTFLNSGGTEKSLGSGSGSGGSGGVNVLLNQSFEDGTAAWANTGGATASQNYINPTISDEKFLRFTANANGQYLEQVFLQWPDNISGGCMADFRQMQGDNSFIIKIIEDPSGTSNIISSYVLSDYTTWQKIPTLTFPCPAAGTAIAIRIESTTAGVIDLDSVYLGGNKGFISSASVEKISTKFLPTDVSATTNNITALSFADLSIGTRYIVRGLVDIESPTNSDSVVTFYDAVGGNVVSIIGNVNTAGNTVGRLYSHVSFEFKATTSNLIVGYVSVGGTLSGNGAKSSTYLQLIEKTTVQQEAFVPEQADFFIDVGIGGDTIVLTNTAGVASEITNNSLNMVINKGSAGIPCDGVNPSTGLTCSVGSESLGVVFNAPRAGRYKACIQASTTSSGTHTFRIVETVNSSQVVLQASTSAQTNSNLDATSFYQCGFLEFGTSGEKTLRLYYQGNLGGIINADRQLTYGYGREVNITVELVSHNVSRPIIQDMVSTSVASGINTNACKVNNNGSATMDNASGLCSSWLASTTRTSLGVVRAVVDVGSYSKRPVCSATANNVADTFISVVDISDFQFDIYTRDGGASAPADRNFNFSCKGAK